MEQSPAWEANRFSASQEIPHILRETEGSLPHSQVPALSIPYLNIPLPQEPTNIPRTQLMSIFVN